ncbi:MAG: carbon monoxide dehydrogenase [Burkholderiales bacterium 66-5]|nr:MAG: carbon monoxide dehydrogenase [Burkholderiales bacterium 66-5]
MKPAPFHYVRPETLEDALSDLARHPGEARIIAGGQSLVAMMNLRLAHPELLVDINGLQELDYHRVDSDMLCIGALARHAALAASPLVQKVAPLMSAAYPHVAHSAVRNRGTLAGNLCHADPASEMPAVMLALDARFRARSVKGDREIAATDFFLGPYTTALAEDEMLVEIRVPVRQCGYGFEEVSIRQGDFALTLVAATLSLQAGRVHAASIAYAGVEGNALRIASAEKLLIGEVPSDALFERVAAEAANVIQPGDDMHADAAYRLDMIRTLTPRALRSAAATA